MALQIRPANRLDASEIAALCGQLGYPTSSDVINRRLLAFADDDSQAILVACDQDRILGWTQVMARAALVSGAYAELEGLVVREGERSRGVGRRLLEAAEAWARGKGLGKIRVRSNVVRERAHGFYLRAGFGFAKSQSVFDKPQTSDSDPG